MEFSGIEKFSLVDFEGKISCTLFFGGCNFKCPFCHNRSLVDNPHLLGFIPFEEIMSFLMTRRGLIDAVVITGGEPTLMSDLKDKIKMIKDLGFLIKLDSNGSNPDVLEDLIKDNLLDYIAMDIKNSYSKYQLTTDSYIDIEKIKRSINIIMNSGVDYEFRTTLVSEYHSFNDIKEISKMIAGAKRMRLQKFVASENCICKDLHEVDIEDAEEYLEEIKKTISDASLRGY